jgi:hypothetical protein
LNGQEREIDRAAVSTARTFVSRGRPFTPEGTAFSEGFRASRSLLLLMGSMDQIDIELWRVGAVACFWMTDWRRIRIVSAGETLSDQTFTSPSEALASARELRRFFRFVASRTTPPTTEVSVA